MWRHLPLLLLLYVTLDFANPLMPGAVSFVAGSIEVVQADRTVRATRPAATTARLVAVLPTWSVVPTDAALARSAPLPLLPSRRSLRAVRRTPPHHFAASRSPSEDH
jgi:hypothetical protein